eukprot:scaffold16086_cov33-Tisochrysis_lutea.AAC.3
MEVVTEALHSVCIACLSALAQRRAFVEAERSDSLHPTSARGELGEGTDTRGGTGACCWRMDSIQPGLSQVRQV